MMLSKKEAIERLNVQVKDGDMLILVGSCTVTLPTNKNTIYLSAEKTKFSNVRCIKDTEESLYRACDFLINPSRSEINKSIKYNLPVLKVAYKNNTSEIDFKKSYYDAPLSRSSLITKVIKGGLKALINRVCQIASIRVKRVTNVENSVALVKLDSIGDYILFRNFLPAVKRQYSHVAVVVNITVKDVVESLDANFIDETIYINYDSYKLDPIYRARLFRKLKLKRYSTALNCLYSRHLISEQIMEQIVAERKVACKGDLTNIEPKHKARYDRIYTELMENSPGIKFEFYRNKEIFQSFLKKDLSDIRFSIEKEKLPKIRDKRLAEKVESEDYITIFIGASKKNRRYRAYQEIIEHILSKTKYGVILCGNGEEDLEYSETLTKQFGKERLLSSVNLVSLPELASVMERSRLTVGNDSSGAHISNALEVPSITLAIQTDGRFAPYPTEMAGHKRRVTLAPEGKYGLHPKCLEPGNNHVYLSNARIDCIPAKRVIEEVDKLTQADL